VKRFGVTPAVDGVTLAVHPREIVCLIGPNGAGKTTLLNCVSGDHDLDGGSITLLGRPVGHTPPHRRSRLGLGRTFQVPSLLPELTVAEHLTLVRQESKGLPDLPDVYRPFEGPLAGVRARELSLGDRRGLEIALALAGDPGLLLLDEPAAGLSRDEAARLAGTLLDVRERTGCAMVAVEHDMEIVRRLADRVIVLHQGHILSEGSMDDMSADQRVRDAYLGAG
ncbi:MAG: ABC transporter ATP-binding protein, partial [Streptosporangiaceae bacterium]